MNDMNRYLVALLIILFLGCKKEDNSIVDPKPDNSPNILFIIADDMGKDATYGFSEGSLKPATPNINKLKNTGLSFSNLWVTPTCSPTRAAIITGKYGYRTGVKWAGDKLATSENILHNYIKQQTGNIYTTALIGKWHLSGNNSNINPETFGIDYFAGMASGTVADYYNWSISEDGSSSTETEYATKYLTDLAIDWIDIQEKPWFLWLAYNAPHTPFHVPPATMHSQGVLPDYQAGMDALPYYMASIEAMDFQIGQLVESIPADELGNTIIIFIGDNGSPNEVAQSPYSNTTVKGSLYQGGINTPMFISGSGVSRTGTDENLICGTDLFTTIANLAGIEVSEINDSKSFASLLTSSSTIRNYQYSEMDNGTKNIWAIRNKGYKIIANGMGVKEMYDLVSDPYESTNLKNGSLSTEQQEAKAELETELSRIRN